MCLAKRTRSAAAHCALNQKLSASTAMRHCVLVQPHKPREYSQARVQSMLLTVLNAHAHAKQTRDVRSSPGASHSAFTLL